MKKPPIASKRMHIFHEHGQERVDDYYYMNDRNSKEVIDYIVKENEYCREYFSGIKELQSNIFAEIKSRVKEDDASVPIKEDDYFYYHRMEKDKQHAIYCRKYRELDADEEIILDVNELALESDSFALGAFRVSGDHRFLAYSIDSTGSERFTICIKDLQTGKVLLDSLTDAHYGLEWANDNRTFFYVRQNAEQRPFQLVRHIVGTPQSLDKVIYEEEDGQFFVSVDKSRDEKYIFLNLEGAITSESYYLAADSPNSAFTLIKEREHGIEYYPTIDAGELLILTNWHAPNFQLVKAPLENSLRWSTFIQEPKDVYLEDFDYYEKYIVLYTRKNGLQNISVIDKESFERTEIPFTEPSYEIEADEYGDYDSDILRYQYSSLITPSSVMAFHMRSKRLNLLKEREIPGGYRKEDYVAERIWVKSHDGVEVPVSLCYAKNVPNVEARPICLSGYGAYGVSSDVYFSTSRLSLLDRGFVWAVAHVRGGSELGRNWYETGKFLQKTNTFKDFLSCSEVLKQRFKGPLCISGGSAGGMLIGVCINQRPDLYQAASAHVPFVDVLTTMLDKQLPLTELEYDEWGNPEDKVYYEYIKSYSPYDNVCPQFYPPIFVTSGLHDPRVTYWEPTKWVAKLRAEKKDDNVLLLKTNMSAGHAGKSGRFDAIEEIAQEYAFFLNELGLKE